VLLTVFFLFDDVLIYLLLDNVFDLQVAAPWVALILSVLLFTNTLLAVVVYRVMQKQPTTGSEGMIGKSGTVVRVGPQRRVHVRINGELWQAECEERLNVGDKVRVDEIAGMELTVRKQA